MHWNSNLFQFFKKKFRGEFLTNVPFRFKKLTFEKLDLLSLQIYRAVPERGKFLNES